MSVSETVTVVKTKSALHTLLNRMGKLADAIELPAYHTPPEHARLSRAQQAQSLRALAYDLQVILADLDKDT